MKTYSNITAGSRDVTITESGTGQVNPLMPKRSQLLRNHSPDGFNWGYGGSGPAQLALAILLDFTDSAPLALELYQTFKEDFIAKFGRTWELTGVEIQRWIDTKTERQPNGS